MEWRRVKNMIILILAIVNAALLVLVVTRRSEVLRYEQSALSQTVRVLAERGIAVEEDALSAGGCALPRTTGRSIPQEAKLASALLGEQVEGVNLGGGLYTYRTGVGQVSIRPGGELSAALNEAPRWRTNDPLNHAAGILEDMGIQARRVSAELADGTGRLVFRQLVDKTPVFSCQVTFYYESGRLTTLTGSLLAFEAAPEEQAGLLALPTVLMRFLEGVLESGDVCTSISLVEPGYRATRSFSGAVRLSPAWLISTNTGDYYVDGVTGELTRVG